MSASDAMENAVLLITYNATTWANYAINATSSPQTDIANSLHTADPGDAGTMSTSEAAYTDYARVDVVRSAVGWTVTANSVSPAAAIEFPVSGASGTTITHWATGKTGGGAAAILVSGTVTPNIAIGSAGITPTLSTASAITCV